MGILEQDIQKFRSLIVELSGEDVGKCIQCGKCSAGCPVAGDMDYMPNQVMELIRIGYKERLLRANTFWFCVSCQTCSARCPEDIDIARIMNALRKLTLKEGVAPAASEISRLNQIFVDSIEKHGRVYEMGMVVKYNLMTGQPLKDAHLGPSLIAKGKISLLPHKIRGLDAIKTLFKKSKRYD